LKINLSQLLVILCLIVGWAEIAQHVLFEADLDKQFCKPKWKCSPGF